MEGWAPRFANYSNPRAMIGRVEAPRAANLLRAR